MGCGRSCLCVPCSPGVLLGGKRLILWWMRRVDGIWGDLVHRRNTVSLVVLPPFPEKSGGGKKRPTKLPTHTHAPGACSLLPSRKAALALPFPCPREDQHKRAGTSVMPRRGWEYDGPTYPRASPTIVPSQVPRPQLQLGLAQRRPNVIRKANENFGF